MFIKLNDKPLQYVKGSPGTHARAFPIDFHVDDHGPTRALVDRSVQLRALGESARTTSIVWREMDRNARYYPHDGGDDTSSAFAAPPPPAATDAAAEDLPMWTAELSPNDFYPTFVDEKDYVDYCRQRLFSLKRLNLLYSSWPIMLLSSLGFATRCGLGRLDTLNPCFALAVGLSCLNFSLLYVFVGAFLVQVYYPADHSYHVYGKVRPPRSSQLSPL